MIGKVLLRVSIMRRSARDASGIPDRTDSVQVHQPKFAAKGLCTKHRKNSPGPSTKCDFADKVLGLPAAHTIGTTACFFVEDRLYNFGTNGNADPSINPEFLTEMKGICPRDGDMNMRVPCDGGSEFEFDKQFLENVREGNGVLESDANMYAESLTRPYIDSYFGLLGGLLGPSFESEFANSMIKLGQIGLKSGSNGRIRRACSAF